MIPAIVWRVGAYALVVAAAFGSGFFHGNQTHPDPEIDRRVCCKRGHIESVRPDGWVWGRIESKQFWIAEGREPAAWPGQGLWVIVKIPGVAVGSRKELEAQQVEDDSGMPLYDGIGLAEPVPRVFRPRRWRVLVDSIPNNVRNALLRDGEISVTPTQIRNYVRRVRDDLQYADL